jgi:hypothetical protein
MIRSTQLREEIAKGGNDLRGRIDSSPVYRQMRLQT